MAGTATCSGPDPRALAASSSPGPGFRLVRLGADPEALELMDALTRLWFPLAFRQGWGRRVGRFVAEPSRSAGDRRLRVLPDVADVQTRMLAFIGRDPRP